ncbi:hypothetical protein [Petrachloros mirabilis]
MKINRMGQAAAVCFWVLTGCASTGERIEIAIPGAATQGSTAIAQTGNGLRVVVETFDDGRTDHSHLGTRSHFWGSTSHFDLQRGTVGEAVAKGIVQQLNKRGWQASLAGQGGSSRPDATISGNIQDLSLTAVSRFGGTEITAKNAMMVRVANHGDESSVQERVFGSANNEVFWFDPSDAEHLVNELIERNIEKFVADTKVEGGAVRLR